ncbi:MAG: 30S ribosomal protein S7 [Candidatus Parvarchaeota archaeon]|nr:30S ribosomal protein S7 [Candidatus Parvarchaeota archaeon]
MEEEKSVQAEEKKMEEPAKVKETKETKEHHLVDYKLFNKYDLNVEVRDPGLRGVIALKPVIAPKSSGRTSQQRLARARVNIAERLITHLMVPGHKGKKHLRTSKLSSGRFYTAFNIVDGAFSRLQKDGKNPVEVLVRAIENSAPREEVMSLLIAGQRIAKQVDTSPMRRLDLALRWIAEGTFQLSFTGKKAKDALYEVLLGAYNRSDSAFPISKRIDTERQAASSR